jgi:prolipoprotein diacylglyceryl transferase
MNLFINWDVSPEIIDGWKTPNLYGLLFVTGMILGYFAIKRIFKKEHVSEDILEKLVMYMVVSIIVGARLGHVIFYGQHYDKFDSNGMLLERGYYSHPLDILKVYEGGLASHGAVMAIVLVLWWFSKKVSHKPMLWILDRISISAAVTACFIRLANLVNSEIVGDITTVPWGFKFFQNSEDLENKFMNGVEIPIRHATQLYEAIVYFFVFILLIFMYWKKDAQKRPGLLFGTILTLVFTARFLIEFIKLGQSDYDQTLTINTGQMLSVPFVLAGVFFLVRAFRSKPVEE